MLPTGTNFSSGCKWLRRRTEFHNSTTPQAKDARPKWLAGLEGRWLDEFLDYIPAYYSTPTRARGMDCCRQQIYEATRLGAGMFETTSRRSKRPNPSRFKKSAMRRGIVLLSKQAAFIRPKTPSAKTLCNHLKKYQASLGRIHFSVLARIWIIWAIR